jgi:hypothetical protein
MNAKLAVAPLDFHSGCGVLWGFRIITGVELEAERENRVMDMIDISFRLD